MSAKTEAPTTLAAVGRQLVENGYRIVPIPPGRKGPVETGWSSLRADVATVDAWTRDGRGAWGVGILGEETPALDLDIADAKILGKVLEWCEARGLTAGQRVGRAPRVLLPCHTSAPFRKTLSRKYRSPDGETHQIEVLSKGGQWVAYHEHPATGRPYAWSGAEPLDTAADLLPPLSAATARELIAFFESIAPAAWVPISAAKEATTGEATADRRANLWDIECAMRAIPNDCDREEWIRVAHALKAAVGENTEDGRALFHEWSEKHESYDPDDTDAAWDGIKDVRNIGAGTLFRMAQGAGWQFSNPRPEDEFDVADIDAGEVPESVKAAVDALKRAAGADSHRPRYRILDYDAMQALPNPVWLVPDVVQKRTSALIFGDSNAFKSFLALDMALSVATGRQWHGRPIDQGRALYVATEGQIGMAKQRIPGWYDHHQVPPNGRYGLHLLPQELTLDVEADVKALLSDIAAIGGIDLMVLDIFAGTMKGTEVEDTTARAWVNGIRRILEAGIAVLTVAHTGWTDNRRARGHSHFWGSFDSRLKVEGDKEKLTTLLSVERHKDADSRGKWGFRLEPDHGTLVPVLDETVLGKAKAGRLPPAQAKALAYLEKAKAEHGELRHGDGWPLCPVVPLEKWKAECDGGRVLSSSTTESGPRMAFNRAKEALLTGDYLKEQDGYVWSVADEF